MIKEQFEKWLKEKEGKSSNTASSYKSSINKISRHYSEQNNEEIDLYNIDDISFVKEIVKYYGIGGKYEEFGKEGKATVRNAIAAYARFVEEKPKYFRKDDNVPPIDETPQSIKIFEYAIEKIKDINRNSKNHNKAPIFKASLYEYSEEIEEACLSLSQFKDLTYYLHKLIFKDFILNLYIIIYETTREETSNNTKGKPFYDYKLPDEFIKNGTTTRHFMDIVGTLRHHYAHLEPEYKVSIKKISYGDVLNELLGSRDEPESREDFQKLQIEVLKIFDEAMKDLLKIVKTT